LAWTISFDPAAEKDLARLDKSIQRRVADYLRRRVAPAQDPEAFGKALTGTLSGLFRYRVGDYRIVC
jgi:mRNA interferase RelE/StbE